MRNLGWITVTRVAAKESHARRGQKGGRRVPKDRLIEVKKVKKRDGEEVLVPLHAKNGALGIRVVADTGEPLFLPLKRLRTLRRGNRRGFRFYNAYEMPEEYATREVIVRLHNRDEEKLNRAENLRAIPPDDPDFERLYTRRSDAESLNRHLEDTLHLKRAHSVGHVRQEADLLGFALMVNSLTLARHRAREGLSAA